MVVLLPLGGEVNELSDEEDMELPLLSFGVDFSKKRFLGGKAEVSMVLPDLTFFDEESRFKLHACEPPNLRFREVTDAFADGSLGDFLEFFADAEDFGDNAAALSRASPCCKTTEGDKFCGRVFALTRKILGEGVVVVVVVVVVEVVFAGVPCCCCCLPCVVEAFILATLIRFCSQLCWALLDAAGTDKMLVRERDFIILMGVEVLVCMRLISESSSSSYSSLQL